MKKILILSTISLLVLLSCEEDIIKPENHKPIIFSLTAFPDVVSPSDSVIIICNAMDPDADTLVYDWSTDGKSKIKGAQNPDFILNHTYENSRVVYPEIILHYQIHFGFTASREMLKARAWENQLLLL
jgi:hypothetical protein